MVQYFATIFEDIRQERSLIILLSVTDAVISSQSKFTDHEISFMKDLAVEKLHRQRILKETVSMDLLEKQFSN